MDAYINGMCSWWAVQKLKIHHQYFYILHFISLAI